ncbi:MAG: hypothetical protein LBU22_08025 [Dysgonamonadaceae bacterium]|jgi:hypothetical protein|nr:hypothetical protein [Dysgonamonadaceae bacterium]
MKKILFIFLLSVTVNCFSQNDLTSIQEINFYGVDFSHANLFGLEESPGTIKSGLVRINDLFISEMKKYDISRYFKKGVLNYCLKATDENNDKIVVGRLVSEAPFVELSEDEISGVLASLDCKDGNGVGLVFIAENLNKPRKTASYIVAFFDESTKRVLYKKSVSGKPFGFGIRNFWAGSIFQIMKNWKY